MQIVIQFFRLLWIKNYGSRECSVEAVEGLFFMEYFFVYLVQRVIYLYEYFLLVA